MAKTAEKSPETTEAKPEPLPPVQHSTLYEALLAARNEFPEIKRDQEATVISKRTNSTYKFKYASLDAIITACWPVLQRHGLVAYWKTDQKGEHVKGHAGEHVEVSFYVRHAPTGEYESNSLHTFAGADLQGLGSAITYLRRYSCAPLLGIAPDEDDDAHQTPPRTAAKSQSEPRRSAPAAKPPAKPPAQAAAPESAGSPAQAPTDKVAVARSWISSCTALADMTKLLRDLQKTDKPEFKVGTPGYQAVIDEAGKHAELMLQSGKWQEDYCGDLWTLLEAMKKAIDTDQQAKGLF